MKLWIRNKLKTPLGANLLLNPAIWIIGSIWGMFNVREVEPWWSKGKCEICGNWMNVAANSHQNFDSYYANFAFHFIFIPTFFFIMTWAFLILVYDLPHNDKT